MKGRRRLKQSSGAALIEAAIALTTLLLIGAILIDIGLYINGLIAVTNASRDGARYASLLDAPVPKNDARIETLVDLILTKTPFLTDTTSTLIAASNPNADPVVELFPPPPCDHRIIVTVRARYNSMLLRAFGWPGKEMEEATTLRYNKVPAC